VIILLLVFITNIHSLTPSSHLHNNILNDDSKIIPRINFHYQDLNFRILVSLSSSMRSLPSCRPTYFSHEFPCFYATKKPVGHAIYRCHTTLLYLYCLRYLVAVLKSRLRCVSYFCIGSSFFLSSSIIRFPHNFNQRFDRL
jgi:hypothetical protein